MSILFAFLGLLIGMYLCTFMYPAYPVRMTLIKEVKSFNGWYGKRTPSRSYESDCKHMCVEYKKKWADAGGVVGDDAAPCDYYEYSFEDNNGTCRLFSLRKDEFTSPPAA